MPEITLDISEKTWEGLIRLAAKKATTPEALLKQWVKELEQRTKDEVAGLTHSEEDIRMEIRVAIRTLRLMRSTPTAPIALQHAALLMRIANTTPLPELRAALPLLRADWFLLIPPPEYTAAYHAIKRATAPWRNLPIPAESAESPANGLPLPATEADPSSGRV